VLLRPRPSHIKKKEGVIAEFKKGLGEARFGLHTEIRSLWAKTGPDAVHVLTRDQAGFHLKEGEELPAGIRIIDLPPYSPELNPCEQLWDLIKDPIGNRVLDPVKELQEAVLPALRRFWERCRSSAGSGASTVADGRSKRFAPKVKVSLI